MTRKHYLNLLILMLAKPLLERFDLRRQHPRMMPRERQSSAHEPDLRLASLPPHSPQFSFLVKTPDSVDSIRKLISADTTLRIQPYVREAPSHPQTAGCCSFPLRFLALA
jgi:hypothetical protein